MKMRSVQENLFWEPYERLNYESQIRRDRMMQLAPDDPEYIRLGNERIAIAHRQSELVQRNITAYFDAMMREAERQRPAEA